MGDRKEKVKASYIPPRAKTAMSAYFCRGGSSRDLKMGMGRTASAQSVTMFDPALKNL